MLPFAALSVLCVLLSLGIATANWVLVAAILGGLLMLLVVRSGMKNISFIWLIGIPTVFVFPNNYLDVLPVVTVDRLLFVLLVGLLASKYIFDKMYRIELIPLERWGVIFLAIAFCSFLGTVGDRPLKQLLGADLSFLVQGYVMPITAFFIARRIMWRPADIYFLFWSLLGVGVFLAFTAILQLFMGISIFVPQYMEVVHSESRATGTFSNASEYGLVMNALLLIGIYLYLTVTDRLGRVLVLLSLFLIMGGILLSETRATWVGVACSLLVIYLFDHRVRPMLTVAAVLASVTAAVALPFFLDSETIYHRVTELSPIYNRLAAWATGLNMMLQHPLLGIGFGNGTFGLLKQDYIVGFGDISGQWVRDLAVPHNEYIHIGALTGVVGLSVYLGLFYRVVRLVVECYREQTGEGLQRDLAIYGGAIALSFFVNGLFVDTGKFNYIAILMYFLLGVMASRCATTSPVVVNTDSSNSRRN